MKISFGTINITKHSKKLIHSMLDANRVSSGKYVAEFKRRFDNEIDFEFVEYPL